MELPVQSGRRPLRGAWVVLHLKAAAIPAKSYGKSDSNHSRLNDDLGKPDDPATQEFYKFLEPLIGQHGSADGKRSVDRQ
jgi:hypothetical protein